MKGGFLVIDAVSGAGKTTLAEEVLGFLESRNVTVVLNAEPSDHCPVGKVIRAVIDGEKPSGELLESALVKIIRFRKEMEKRFSIMPVSEQGILRNFLELPMQAIKKILKDDRPEPNEFQSLYVVDRYFDIVEFILPHVEKGFWVLNDRFLLSTFGYGGAYGVFLKDIYDWHRVVLDDLWHLPAATFYLRVTAETAAERLFGSGKTIDIWEKKEKIASLVDHYDLSVNFLKKESVREGVPDTFHIIDGEQDKEGVFQQVGQILTPIIKAAQ